MRALPFDSTGGYSFNSSIAQSRIQQLYPLVAVGSSNTIQFEVAPTGSAADFYDFKNSKFNLKWGWVSSVYAAGGGGAYPPVSQWGSSFALFHSLLLFATVRIYLNGVEVDDESNNYQHMADFHKIILMEPYQPFFGGNFFDPPRNLFQTGIISPFYYHGHFPGDLSSSPQAQLANWLDTCDPQQTLAVGNNIGAPAPGGTVYTTYQPYQSIFLCPQFIPSSVRVRFEFTKFSSTWDFARTAICLSATSCTSPINLTLDEMVLYLRVVTLTNQTLQAASKMAIQMPMTLPVMRAQTTVFPISVGTSSINIQVTGMRRPQVVILHVVPTSSTVPFVWPAKDAFVPELSVSQASVCPFATSTSVYPTPGALPFFGQPSAVWQVKSLYLRCGTQRYPALYDRTRTSGAAWAGGTVQQEYDEYANLTKQYATGDTQATQPFLSQTNFSDPNWANIFVFNMSPQQETFQDRSIVETMAITGTLDIIAQIVATVVDCRLFVTTLTNEMITIESMGGRIGKTW